MSPSVGLSETTVALVAGFGGAVVGGALALVGNLIAARRELTRKHRVRLYTEFVPRLLAHLRGHAMAPYVTEDADAVDRAATVAGRRDRRRARATVADATVAVDRALQRSVQSASGAVGQTDAERVAFEEALGRAIASAERYERWLAKRF